MGWGGIGRNKVSVRKIGGIYGRRHEEGREVGGETDSGH